MSQKSAVTDSITYKFEPCHFCNAEVGLGAHIPEGEPVKKGYIVILGQDSVSITENMGGTPPSRAELKFETEKSEIEPPHVKGHIVCEDCAETVHGHTPTEYYNGPLPRMLANGTRNQDTIIDHYASVLGAVLGIMLGIALLLNFKPIFVGSPPEGGSVGGLALVLAGSFLIVLAILIYKTRQKYL